MATPSNQKLQDSATLSVLFSGLAQLELKSYLLMGKSALQYEPE